MIAVHERTTLPILSTKVWIPAWLAAGHDPSELPTEARIDRQRWLLPWDVRDYPDLVNAATSRANPNLRGIWTSHSIRYEREDGRDLMSWILRRFSYWSEEARRKLFWREARPLCIEELCIGQNVLTDWWVLNMMMRTIGAAGWSTPNTANHIILANGSPAVQITSQAGSTFTVVVGATWSGTSFSNAQILTVGYGSTHPETLTVSGTPTGTSITVTTTPAFTHAANEWIVLAAQTTDNPSSIPAGFYDSGAITGTTSNGSNGFAYTGSGTNGRQVQAVENFPSNAGAPASGYTDKYLSNIAASSYVVNSTAAHQTSSPITVNSTLGVNIGFTDTF